MKKLLLVSTILFTAIFVNAQSIPELGAVYNLRQSEMLNACNADGIPVSPVIVENIPSNTLYKIERLLSGGDVVISILKWPVTYITEEVVNGAQKQMITKTKNQKSADNETLNTKFRGGQGSSPTKFFFLPSAKFLLTIKKEKRSSWNFATGSTIIKYRPGSSSIASDIGNDFNVGLLAAYSIKQDEEKLHSLLFGIGVGSIKVTPATTKNTITEDSNLASISPTIGYVFQVKGGQIGFMTGLDILSGKSYKSWDYRGRPWIGFGIGFSLFKISSPTISNSVQQSGKP